MEKGISKVPKSPVDVHDRGATQREHGFEAGDSCKVILADDHQLVRKGIGKILSEMPRPGIEIVGEASDGVELLNLLKGGPCDLVIMDIVMPRMSALEALAKIKELYPQVKLLILSMHEDPIYLESMMAGGADAYVSKEAATADLYSAIEAILNGKTFISPTVASKLVEWHACSSQQEPGKRRALTHREIEVLRLLSAGKSSKEIAGVLGISTRTAEHHRSNIFRKLRVNTLPDLVKLAIRLGYDDLNT